METDKEAAEKTRLNAIEHNIKEKGQNAYYYAHQDSGKEEVTGFSTAPQKLPVANVKAGNGVEVKRRTKMISKYSWTDNSKTVSLYINLPNLDALPVENIVLDFKEKGKYLKIRLVNLDGDGVDHELNLMKLHDEIKKATFRKKDGDRLLVTLFKVQEFSWYELQQK